jgi:hypothetical protein
VPWSSENGDPVKPRWPVGRSTRHRERSEAERSSVGVGVSVPPRWQRDLGTEAAEAACKRMLHAVKP